MNVKLIKPKIKIPQWALTPIHQIKTIIYCLNLIIKRYVNICGLQFMSHVEYFCLAFIYCKLYL